MKKMLILAGVAMLTMVSTAASLKWSIGANSWDAEKPGAGKLYYIVLSSATASGDLATALASKNKEAIFTALEAESLVKASGTFASAGSTANGSLTDDSILSGSKYSVAVIAFDGADAASSEKFFVSCASSEGDGYVPPATPGATAGFVKTATKVSGTWTSFSGDVPEPTSAMLLLLGVAGLALRRRA